ncbi:MAG: cupin domain-containing protein [Solirubrobacteraceae bacterium]
MGRWTRSFDGSERVIETVNILDAVFEGRFDIGAAAGSSGVNAFVYDIAPGTSSCPYHYEYVDEWMLVIAGSVVARTPEGERPLTAGALVRFPAGPSEAHKVMNRTESPARTMLFSNDHGPAVSVYPDSNKVGVWPEAFDENGMIFVRYSAVPWSYGEDGWDRAE